MKLHHGETSKERNFNTRTGIFTRTTVRTSYLQQASKSTPNSSVSLHFINSFMITDWLPTNLHPAYFDRFTKELSYHCNSLISLRCKTAQRPTIGLLLYLMRILFHSFSSYGVPMAKKGRRKHTHTHTSGVGSDEPLRVEPTWWEWKWRKTELSTWQQK